MGVLDGAHNCEDAFKKEYYSMYGLHREHIRDARFDGTIRVNTNEHVNLLVQR